MIQTFVNWFTALFAWFGRIFQWIKGVFLDLMEFVLDLPVKILEGFLDGVIYLLSAIPVPEFLEGGGLLQGLFSGLHPDVQYLVNFFGIPLGLAMIGGGVLFRLTRKAFTLGQW